VLEKSIVWVRSLLDAGDLFLVVCDDSNVVGWCDAGRIGRDGFRHRAELGMGLLPEFRRMGIGSRLLEQAISWARNREIEILELSVFASNASARSLYARFGFTVEGVRTRARKLDDVYDDVILMALHLRTSPATPRAG
jgi:RimJ/RimL family protein N-acetyltransferase